MPPAPYFIFLAEMDLHGILSFSSEIRPAVAGVGAVHITSHFIHNYPLIYAFNKKIAEAYAVIPSLHLPLKRRRVKFPLQYTFVDQVLKEVQRNGLRHVYAYPAYPIEVTTKKFFLSAKGYGYVEKAKRQIKDFYPTETHWIALVPPTRHRTILISPYRLPGRLYIRIGMKRAGIYKVTLEEADLVNIKRLERLTWSTVPVNLYDTRLFGYRIEAYTKVLETRSAPKDAQSGSTKWGANIIGYVQARDLYEVNLPRERIVIPLPKTLVRRPKDEASEKSYK